MIFRQREKRIWISWLNHRRNIELSKAMKLNLYQIEYKGNRLLRYFLSSCKTFNIIRRENPTVVFAQNPSLILPIFLLGLKKIFNFILIVDAHNAGVYPLEGVFSILNRVAGFVHRKADLTIVSNDALKIVVEHNKGKAFILPDKIPEIPENEKVKLRGDYNFLLICSFSKDEPFSEALSAMKDMPRSWVLYVSGDFRRVKNMPTVIPNNVVLTGYLPDQEYFKLLGSVDAVINLTLRDNCLLCGAYETVAVEKPLILSDKKALREYFFKGAVFVENTENGIKDGIVRAINEREILLNEVKSLKDFLTSAWSRKKRQLEVSVEELLA